jgi:RNA polymerase sigma-70 factor (ECF subfamily)
MERDRLDALYRKYGKMVFRRARALLGDTQGAHDAVQDIFLRAMNARAEFEHAASPVAWLCKITTNHCLNRLRDADRRRVLLEVHRPATDEVGPPSAESHLAVGDILRRLPAALAEIGVYYYIDQMNQDEIAELLGVSRRTVGNRLDEFRAALAALLSPNAEALA